MKSLFFLIVSLFVISLIGLTTAAIAEEQELDEHSRKALEQTQELLKNSQARETAMKGDSKAIGADAFVQQLTGNKEASEEIYALAADVFSLVVKDAQGDPGKMTQAMEKFSRDPASFAAKWTPEQKEKLRKLGIKLDRPITKK